MMYYFFDEYGNCFEEGWFATEEEAKLFCLFCDKDDVEYFRADQVEQNFLKK